jgi:poly-gamma-glutamate synthesis protein (capsule biosynthesis protein)
MIGRGVDQIQQRSVSPELFEAHARSARDYVALAEGASGPLPRGVAPDYVWGDALGELARVRPAARIVNLETALTTSPSAWPGKAVHYRAHPENARILRAAGIDCCSLANNHVLDWGREGLRETLAALAQAGVRSAGAGLDVASAEAPALLPVGASGRVLVFAFATLDCGTAPDWAASASRPGIALVPELVPSAVAALAARVEAHKLPGDSVVASIHWGANWGWEVPSAQRAFAHALIERAGVDVVHGHSSHHPKGIEVHRGRLIVYGCGDFLDDYEGIAGQERYRPELGLMFFPTLDAKSGALRRLELVPTRVHRFRVERAAPEQVAWLAAKLDRESEKLGARVRRADDGTLQLGWNA